AAAWLLRRSRHPTLSRIHDALRRGEQPDRTAHASAHADAVLATLGYKSEKSGSTSRRLIALLIVVLLLGGAYWVWTLWPSSPPVRPQLDPRVVVRQTPPSQPAPRPISPSPAPTSP